MQDRSAHPHEDTVLKKLLLEIDDWLRVRVLESSLNELTVLSDEVESTEETSNTTLSKAVVLLKHLLHALRENLLHFLGVADNVFLHHVSHGLVASNARYRMCLIGSTPTDGISPVEILDSLAETGSREWEIRARETLGTSEDVGDHTVVGLIAEHLTAATYAGHNLIDY